MNPYTQSLYQHYASLGKALSTPARIELLELLLQAPHSVEELSQLTGLSMANTSQHLQHLRQVQLVRSEKKGLHVIYRLASPMVGKLLQVLADVAQSQLAEVRQLEADFLAECADWEAVTLAELPQRLQEGALLLDVRPTNEFRMGHIPGAISLPLPELASRLAELPRNQKIIAYCRGPYCLLAQEALQQLSHHGYAVSHLRVGLSGWLAQYPVAVGH